MYRLPVCYPNISDHLKHENDFCAKMYKVKIVAKS